MIKNRKDLYAGWIFILVGLAFVWMARAYEFGSARSMGPGYFPTVLGVVLALLGIAVAFRSLAPGKGEDSPFAWKALGITTIATVVFGMIVRGAGLIPAVFVLVMISASVSIRFRWATAVPLAVGLAIFSWFVFIREIGLPFAPFGPWFGR